MATFEQAEKLREKANVSFEDAKAALDASDGDLLDALIWLEKQGKVTPPDKNGYYSSENSSGREEKSEGKKERKEPSGESFADMMKRFGRFCGNILNKGNTNFFEARRNEKVVVSFPVTVLVILILFLFWVIVPLIIIGLFFGFRYSFVGDDLGKDSVNKVMDGATDTAEGIKRSITAKNKVFVRA
jgi:hypothetical protein